MLKTFFTNCEFKTIKQFYLEFIITRNVIEMMHSVSFWRYACVLNF